jgi:hypothetical protein
MILSTVPGRLVLGGSGIRAASRFRSAILADFEVRGFAISCFRLAGISNPDPEKRDPIPGDPDPTMPPPEPRRNPSPDHGRLIRSRMNHDTIFPSTIHDESKLRNGYSTVGFVDGPQPSNPNS